LDLLLSGSSTSWARCSSRPRPRFKWLGTIRRLRLDWWAGAIQSGSVLDLAAANGFTALGGLCFLAGALLLVPRSEGSSGSGDALRPEVL
jgi:hypothetical protein